MAGFRWSSARRTVAAAFAATDGAADRDPAEEEDGAEKLPSMHRARHMQLTIEPMGEEMPLLGSSLIQFAGLRTAGSGLLQLQA
jgi:hypothetical protein